MTTLNTLKIDTLKNYAMTAAAGKKLPNGTTYTQVVKALSRRLRSNPKKVRRQARTQFWAN